MKFDAKAECRVNDRFCSGGGAGAGIEWRVDARFDGCVLDLPQGFQAELGAIRRIGIREVIPGKFEVLHSVLGGEKVALRKALTEEVDVLRSSRVATTLGLEVGELQAVFVSSGDGDHTSYGRFALPRKIEVAGDVGGVLFPPQELGLPLVEPVDRFNRECIPAGVAVVRWRRLLRRRWLLLGRLRRRCGLWLLG